jgi:hypothetical protein
MNQSPFVSKRIYQPNVKAISKPKRNLAMLHPLWLISKRALLGVIFLFIVMLLCVALLSPLTMCALVNFGY